MKEGALVFALMLSFAAGASAQTQPPRGESQAVPPASPGNINEGSPPVIFDEAKKAEAKGHFEKGLALLKEEAWAAALAEFLTSREIFPTRAATNNAATALRKLQRFDEALDLFEVVLRDFPTMSPADRRDTQRTVAELRDLVGTIEISGAEPGAAIVVSGQNRGEFPLITPLRVAAGTHLLRFFKEGYEPFETRVDVAGGQTIRVTSKLHALTASGRLQVTERTGRALEVLVDNVSVGTTPWEGTLSIGNHTVALRGKGRIGSQPAATPVKQNQVSALALTAEDLDAALRVEPKPAGANVAIDGVPVGNGVWYGWLKSGEHRVEVATDGFVPTSRQVKLERGERALVTVQLDRDSNSIMWRKPPRWTFEANAGGAFVPSLGGEVAGTCTGTCSKSVGIGGLGFLHAGYQRGSGLGFGLAAGYLIATQSVTHRSTQLVPFATNGQPPPQSGLADDTLRVSAFLGGGSLSYHTGDRVPVLVRLGVGALVGQVRDERRGTFNGAKSTVNDFESITAFYFDPEVRVGIRLADHIDVSLGVQVPLLLALSQPTWKQSIEVSAGKDGIGTYRAEPTVGQYVFGFVPSASFRYDL